MAKTKDSAAYIAAMEYAERGWRVIPCRECSKHPEIKEWQKLATTDEDTITAWYAGKYSGWGVSLVFGAESDIIDIDVDKNEDGDTLCREAFGGEWPHTPTYFSARKKTPHRLFKWRSDLPLLANIDLRRKIGLDIDLKLGGEGKGSQSLAPPSKGYVWAPGHTPDDCEPADLPDSFIRWLNEKLYDGGVDPEVMAMNGVDAVDLKKKSPEEWEEIKSGSGEGSRNANMCSLLGRWAVSLIEVRSRQSAQDLLDMALAYNLRNTPPMDEAEVRSIVASVLKMEQRRRAAEDFEQISTASPDLQMGAETSGSKPAEKTGGFRLVIVQGEPRRYELHHDHFRDAPGGCLLLSAKELMNPQAIRLASQEQADHGLPATFNKAWTKKDGLYTTLMASAEKVASDPREDRPALVAQAVLEQVERAKPPRGEEEKPDSRGAATRMSDGTVYIGVKKLRDELKYDAANPTDKEVRKLMKSILADQSRPRASGERPRFWVINATAFRKLQEAAWPELPEVE